MIADDLIDWFWEYGRKRDTTEALGLGGWLDQVYVVRASMRAVAESGRAKRCVALWGPSQTGKSTLLSGFLDKGVVKGASSALQWRSDEPVIFNRDVNPPQNAVQINPHHPGEPDASGCVSRFVLKKEGEVPDLQHPVEIKLATKGHILHAIAAGYLTECDTRNDKGQELFLDSERFQEMLRPFESGVGSPVDRVAYDFLHEFADVLEALIFSEWPRYKNLASSWEKGLRPRLLEAKGFQGNAAAVERFVCLVLWDGHPNINELHRKLRHQREQALKLSANLPILCSYQSVKLFLDIQTVRNWTAEAVMRGRASEQHFVIDSREGTPLFSSAEEFGAWQGIIWEVVLPVNASNLTIDSPARALLSGTDLLDFPGVGNQDLGGALPKPSDMSTRQLLETVLKRGKTACMAATRAKELGIDSFTLLKRFDRMMSKPDQLVAGIRAWAKSLGMPWPMTVQHKLPINILITFGATLVNKAVTGIRANQRFTDYGSVFETLERLGNIASPEVAEYFISTYPHFPVNCRVDGTEEHIQQAAQDIAKSDAFQVRFKRRMDSVFAMVEGGRTSEGDGGLSFFFGELVKQASLSPVPSLIQRRDLASQQCLKGLINEALPLDASSDNVRKDDIAKWIDSILLAIERHRHQDTGTDPVGYVTNILRRLLDVTPDLLDPIPTNCRFQVAKEYCERQLRVKWAQTRVQDSDRWGGVGMVDTVIRQRMLRYLCDAALNNDHLAKWLHEELGSITHHGDVFFVRRFAAIKFAEAVCFGSERRALHREFVGSKEETVVQRLQFYLAEERKAQEDREVKHSPHYRAFLSPFFTHLQTIQNTPSSRRVPQPGDDKLRDLVNKSPL